MQVTLSNQVGQASPQPMLMRAMDSMAMEAAPAGASVLDGVWRYRFDQPFEFQGGQQFVRRIWTNTADIERFHSLFVRLSGQSSQFTTQSLAATRRWELTNTESAGLGLPILPGSVRINSAQPGYELVGDTQLPNLAPGAIHWMELGASQAVRATLDRTSRQINGATIQSVWQLVVENSSDEAVQIQINAGLPRQGEVSGLPRTLQLGPEATRRFAITLTEPRSR